VARRWRGTGKQWRALRWGMTLLGSFAAMLFAFVNLLVTSDLAMSLVPGWASADMPGFHTLSALEGGLAVSLLAAAMLRRVPGYKEYVGDDTFHSGAKLLLAFGLLWFYLFWAEFLTYWYGAMPDEQRLIELFEFGPSRWLFYGAFGLCFLAPFLLLMWNPIRRSVAGPTLAAALVVVGLLCDRVRLFVGAWSVAGPVTEHLETVSPLYWPGPLDVLILLGLPAAALCLALLALRVVPPMSLWETKASRRLRLERAYLQTSVPVLARPA
jgi:hypothetical protein